MAAATVKAPSKGEILKTTSEEAGLSRKQVAAVFESLAGQMRKNLGKKGIGTFTVLGLMRVNVHNKPATKGAQGNQPLHWPGTDVQGQARIASRQDSPPSRASRKWPSKNSPALGRAMNNG